MGGPIDMNIGVFWETSVGFLKISNFSQHTAKVISVSMSQVAGSSMALKNRQAALAFSI